MIEVGKRSECEMTYEDAVFYCFCLGDGWRLPSRYEYMSASSFLNCWWQGDSSTNTWHVIPVRDLKDD